QLPRLSIVIAAGDEARVLPVKLRSLLLQNYPADRIQILVVSDGSRDRTAELATEVSPLVQVIELGEAVGKPAALNFAVARATGDLLVLTDARQPLTPGSLR